MRSSSTRALGARGEEAAAAWYLAAGYRVLDRNWRCDTGELDIVAARGSTLVFCEVKFRSGLGFGTPAEAVGRAKQVRVRRLAARWLAANRQQVGARAWTVRFDVASVLGEQVTVLEGVF